jgi:hypothetical protein
MCVSCLRSKVDISEGISKALTILWCKECGRYLQPPKHWVAAELESKELLTFCIKRIKGLSKAKLVDAGFIWTEPHSKRLKVKLTIQNEVFNGAILQQSFVVEFVVENNMCPDCNRQNANPNSWIACVQVGAGGRARSTNSASTSSPPCSLLPGCRDGAPPLPSALPTHRRSDAPTRPPTHLHHLPPAALHPRPQLRQHVHHKRTFLFLEQLILKHNADTACVNIKDIHEGVDFYFNNRAHAVKFVDFLQVSQPAAPARQLPGSLLAAWPPVAGAGGCGRVLVGLVGAAGLQLHGGRRRSCCCRRRAQTRLLPPPPPGRTSCRCGSGTTSSSCRTTSTPARTTTSTPSPWRSRPCARTTSSACRARWAGRAAVPRASPCPGGPTSFAPLGAVLEPRDSPGRASSAHPQPHAPAQHRWGLDASATCPRRPRS